jgi:hypothetical protein
MKRSELIIKENDNAGVESRLKSQSEVAAAAGPERMALVGSPAVSFFHDRNP